MVSILADLGRGFLACLGVKYNDLDPLLDPELGPRQVTILRRDSAQIIRLAFSAAGLESSQRWLVWGGESEWELAAHDIGSRNYRRYRIGRGDACIKHSITVGAVDRESLYHFFFSGQDELDPISGVFDVSTRSLIGRCPLPLHQDVMRILSSRSTLFSQQRIREIFLLSGQVGLIYRRAKKIQEVLDGCPHHYLVMGDNGSSREISPKLAKSIERKLPGYRGLLV